MSCAPPTIESLTRRLDSLERAHRRLKRGTGLGLIAGASLLLMGQAPDRIAAGTVVGRTVEAQSLVIRDAGGKVRVLLDADAVGPVALTLSDKDGRERLALGVGPAGGVGLVFRDKEGQIRTAVGVGPQGRPFFIPKRRHVTDESARN
jgi:hypothetical protein